VADSSYAYQLPKRCHSLRVMVEALRWGKRGARVNTTSPGIVLTALAKDEFSPRPRGAGSIAAAPRVTDLGDPARR